MLFVHILHYYRRKYFTIICIYYKYKLPALEYSTKITRRADLTLLHLTHTYTHIHTILLVCYNYISTKDFVMNGPET